MRRIVNTVLIALLLIPAAGSGAEKTLTGEKDIKTVTLDTKGIKGKLKAGVVLGYRGELRPVHSLSVPGTFSEGKLYVRINICHPFKI